MLNGIVLLKAAGLFNRIAAKAGRASAERSIDDPQTQAAQGSARCGGRGHRRRHHPERP